MPLQFQLAPETQVISGPDGIDLSVETHGDIAAPLVVVMIHGGYQSRRCFKYQYSTLAFDHFVVGLDLPGHGRSTFPDDGTMLSSALYADCIQSVLTALHLEKKPIVLFQPVLTTFDQTEGEHDSIVHQRFLTHFFERLTLTTSRLDEDTCDAITGYNERAWWNFRSFGGAFPQDLSSSDDTLHELKTLTLPTLLLHGKEDALVPLSFSHAMSRLLPHVELIEIDRCGHSAMLERPAVVNRLIGAFLANLRV